MVESDKDMAAEPHIAKLDIGELLSEKRHRKRETLADISRQIKLSVEVLGKLENNQFEDVGTPVYVRGYLGLYGKYLGLDVAYLIEQYNLQYPAQEVAIKPSHGNSLGGGRYQKKRHSKALSLLAVLSVMGGLFYAYWRMENRFVDPAQPMTLNAQPETPDNETENEQTNSELVTVIDRVDAAETLADDVLKGEVVTNVQPLVTNLSVGLDALEPASAPAADSATDVSQQSQSATEPQAQIEAATDILDEITPVTEQAAEPHIVMTFSDKCWIKVNDGDGKKLMAKIYKAGKTLRVKGKAPLTVVIGNADAVKKLTLNDKPLVLSNYKISKLKYRFPKKNKLL